MQFVVASMAALNYSSVDSPVCGTLPTEEEG